MAPEAVWHLIVHYFSRVCPSVFCVFLCVCFCILFCRPIFVVLCHYPDLGPSNLFFDCNFSAYRPIAIFTSREIGANLMGLAQWLTNRCPSATSAMTLLVGSYDIR